MIGHGKINEQVQFLPGPSHSDISTARTGPYHDVSHARTLAGILTVASVAAGTTLTVTLMQATDANGSGAKVLRAVEVESEGTADSPPGNRPETATVAANVEELDHANGFVFVAVRVDTDAAAAGAGVLALGDLRYGVPA
jgi:hypothetical protein